MRRAANPATKPGSRVGVWAVALVVASVVAAGCHREKRELQPSASEAQFSSGVLVSELRAAEMPPAMGQFKRDYQENAYAMNEGKRLFASYNCTGCHAHGGGAIGPALMDARWIYGSAPANIFATIVEGRPNGMPSFRGKIADFQVGQLVAYVRSMSGLAGGIAAPGRNDEMQVKPAENTEDRRPAMRAEAPRLP